MSRKVTANQIEAQKSKLESVVDVLLSTINNLDNKDVSLLDISLDIYDMSKILHNVSNFLEERKR